MNKNLPVRVFGFPFGLGGTCRSTRDAHRILVQCGLLDALQKEGESITYEDLSLSLPSLIRSPPCARGHPKVKHVLRVRDALRYAYVHATRAIGNGEAPLFLGGDHTLAAATLLASLARYGDDLCVVYVDQHGDAHDHLSSLSGNAHGMPLALAMGYGDRRLLAAGGIASPALRLPPHQILHIGLDPNSIEVAESEFFLRHRIFSIDILEIFQNGFQESLNEIARFIDGHPVHVSFDIDVTDAPGTGYPSKRGFTCAQAVALMQTVRESGNVIACDMVEYCPDKDEPDIDGASWVTINYITKILCALFA